MNSFDHCWAVILAGGSGTRFWPKSRLKSPKQLCKIGSKNLTMLELTLDRLDGLIPPQRRIIVTHQLQAKATKEVVKEKCKYILCEPISKNTSAALAYAAEEIKLLSKNNLETVMFSLHADHIIPSTQDFHLTLKEAYKTASLNYLTLVGIQPRYLETGFGYLKMGTKMTQNNLENSYKVEQFCEKPNHKTAQKYLLDSRYQWNSGIFTWKIKTFQDTLKEFLPQTFKAFADFYSKLTVSQGLKLVCHKDLKSTYETLTNISIDEAILEKSAHIAMVRSQMQWQDVGVWTALKDCFHTDENDNFMSGDILSLETKNCVIDTDCFVATLGIKDLIIVKSNNAILVAHKDKAQDVKKIVDQLKSQEKHDLL